MEIIEGKSTRRMDSAELRLRLAAYSEVLIDLGAGDGRYARAAALDCPGLFAIGVDACRENLYAPRKRPGENPLFVVANARALPVELAGLASRVTAHFPWGSLLAGLLGEDSAVREGLLGLLRPGGAVELTLNASALGEAGWALLPGGERAAQALAQAGLTVRPPRLLDAAALRALPTTWARRLAYSRRPEAVRVVARL